MKVNSSIKEIKTFLVFLLILEMIQPNLISSKILNISFETLSASLKSPDDPDNM